jgi:hypothetical protein
MHVSKTKIWLVSLGIIIIALLAWIAFLPPLSRPNISLTFLGYTNDAAVGQLADFTVTNLSTSPVAVFRPVIEIPDPKAPAGLAFDQSHRPIHFLSALGSGESTHFTIPTPTNQSPWRLTLLADPDIGFAQAVKRFVTRQGGRMPYEIQSQWFQNSTETSNTTLEPTPIAP